MSVSPSNQACLSVLQFRHVCQSIKSDISISLSNEAHLSVHKIRHVCKSIKPRMFISPSNQASLSIKSGMSVSPSQMYISPATIKCTSGQQLKCTPVLQLKNVHQTHNSKMNVNSVSLRCAPVLQLRK